MSMNLVIISASQLSESSPFEFTGKSMKNLILMMRIRFIEYDSRNLNTELWNAGSWIEPESLFS